MEPGKVLKFDYRGAPQTVDVMRRAALEAQFTMPVREFCEDVCQGLQSKDYLSEYLAIYHAVLQRCRYMRDPRTVELVRAPYVIAGELLHGRVPQVDCLPADTQLLMRDMTTRAISDVRIGDEIWGYDRWSRVGNVMDKGILGVDAITMNNGSTFFATPGHKVYIERCRKHPDNPECNCIVSGPTRADLERVRIPVSDLRPQMLLVQPERIPFGSQEPDPDRMYIEGLYLSDGWHQGPAFSISGQDDCPKEAQKAEVEAICQRLGIETTWYRKAIRVRDSEWTRRIELMGGHAPTKHALSIDLGEAAAAQLLRGIMADSGKNSHGINRTFTSTSRQLAVQTRLLHKMFGISCGERYIVDHGGLGKNPIWRLQTRYPSPTGMSVKRLRVKEIEREVDRAPVFDISTDDHYVYLPTADVTVSNCDDEAAFICACVLAVGGTPRITTVAFRDMFYQGQRQYSHVFCEAFEPKRRQWIVLDPVAAERTKQMLKDVRAAKTWAVGE